RLRARIPVAASRHERRPDEDQRDETVHEEPSAAERGRGWLHARRRCDAAMSAFARALGFGGLRRRFIHLRSPPTSFRAPFPVPRARSRALGGPAPRRFPTP